MKTPAGYSASIGQKSKTLETSETLPLMLENIHNANAATNGGAKGTKRISVNARVSRRAGGNSTGNTQSLLPLAGHASHTVLPGSERAQQMTAHSGRKCLELLKHSGQDIFLAKTCLESSAWNSTRCFLTWSPSVTPAGRLIFRLQESVLISDDIGCGWLPSPCKNEDAAGSPNGVMQIMLSNHPWIRETGGYLSPMFTEQLMGYPEGWTELG